MWLRLSVIIHTRVTGPLLKKNQTLEAFGDLFTLLAHSKDTVASKLLCASFLY